jgi:mannose-6-phosphate isomerase
MNLTPIPCRIEPKQVNRIWGRRWLDPLFASVAELAEPIGEVWLTGEDCRFADGPYQGKELGVAWKEMPLKWKGGSLEKEKTFPILAKFLFTDLKLSVQVHPDDAYAARHEGGSRGKSEMWYVVRSWPNAEVFVGVEPGVDSRVLRESLADGTVESRLRRIPLNDGDTIYVPAGTVHTIGAGLVLCEIQESSDITYRLYDYDRTDAEGKPRELHVDKALAVARFGQSMAGKTDPVTLSRGPVELSFLLACRHFAAERWRFVEPLNLSGSKKHFDLLIFLEGSGDFVMGGSRRKFNHGEIWFVPADCGKFRLEPASDTTLLCSYVPELGEFPEQLAKLGLRQRQIAGFLYE